MTPEGIKRILEEYFAPLPGGMEMRVQEYVQLLQWWGRKMSLTSVREPERLVRFHFGESIFALSLGDMGDGRLADVGTGAGFPGLALKLAQPDLSVTLIEPNAKKSAFLHEVIRRLGLSHVEVVARDFRAAQVARSSCDFVTSRALSGQASLLDWAEAMLAPQGSVLLWVGEAESERLRKIPGWRWEIPCLIPRTDARFILKGWRAR